MNKVCGSTVLKILSLDSERRGRLRTLHDIICSSQDDTMKQMKVGDAHFDFGHLSSTKQETKLDSSVKGDIAVAECKPTTSRMQSMFMDSDSNDNNSEESMLKEVQMKKSRRSCAVRKNCMDLSSMYCADLNSGPCIERSTIVGSLMSSALDEMSSSSMSLQLHLDSSTSNSTESTDDVREYVCSNTCSKEKLSKNGDTRIRKRTREALSNCELTLSASDSGDSHDDWTLQMWQSYSKKHLGQSTHKRICLQQGQNAASKREQKSLMSTAISAAIAASNFNTAPVVDSKLFRKEKESSGASEQEVVGLNICQLNSQSVPSTCELQDTGGDVQKQDQEQDLYRKPQEDESPNGEVKNDENDEISFSCENEASGVKPAVCLVLEDDSDICSSDLSSTDNHEDVLNPQAVKPCSSSNSTCPAASNCSAQQHLIHNSDLQPCLSNCSSILQQESSSFDPRSCALRPCTIKTKVSDPKMPEPVSLVSHLGGLWTDLSHCKAAEDSHVSIEQSDKEIIKATQPTDSVDSAVQFMHLSHRDMHAIQTEDTTNQDCRIPGIEFPQSDVKEHECNSKRKNGFLDFPESLVAMESLDYDDEQDVMQYKPAKLPCKRKAISPASTKKLLLASRSTTIYNGLENHSPNRCKDQGMKGPPQSFKGYIGQDNFSQQWNGASIGEKGFAIRDSTPSKEVLLGSCHNKDFLCLLPKPTSSRNLLSKLSSLSGCDNSHSKPRNPDRLCLKPSKTVAGNCNNPTKGILKTSCHTCQTLCECVDCASVRLRAKNASEFSQRQMHDIEGLTTKLLKELGSLRNILEEKLLEAPGLSRDCTIWSVDKVRSATKRALLTEERAEKWLVQMARDCNRYCKVMAGYTLGKNPHPP